MSRSNLKKFQISQQAVILNSSNEVLILKSSENPLEWLLPGGRIEENETPTLAFKREVLEETGIIIEQKEPLATDVNHPETCYAIAFKCEVIDDSNFKLSEEHTEYKWVKPSDLEDFLYYKNIAKGVAKRLG